MKEKMREKIKDERRDKMKKKETREKVKDKIKASRTFRTSSRCSIRVHPSKNGRCTSLFKILKAECPDVWILLPKYKWPTSWSEIEDPVVPSWTKFFRTSTRRGLLWERQFEETLLEFGWEEVPNWECLFVQGWYLSVYVDDITNGWKAADSGSHVEETDEKNVDLDEPHLGCTRRERKPNGVLLINTQKCLNHEFLLEQLKIAGVGKASRKNCRVVIRHGRTCSKKCVQRYCELANRKKEQLYKVSSLCLDDHQFKEEELESVGELSDVCSQNSLELLKWNSYGENPMHPVNQIAREVQKLKRYSGHTFCTSLQPQFIIWKQYSRSSGGSTDENMTTLWMIWTWIWLLGHISECHSSSSANLRYVKNNLWNSVGLLFHVIGKLISEQKEITGVISIGFERCHVDVDKLIVSKGLSDHQRPNLRLLRLCALCGESGRWSSCDLEEQN